MIPLIRFWREIILVLLVISLFLVWSIYSSKVEKRDEKIATLTAEAKLDELQKEALRSAIIDQSDAVEKQRIDAVQRAEVFRVKSESIQAKYERERIRVRDLNGSQECDEMRKIIREAVE